jgi:glycosyltransferase involved in cell wall biosynthesis
MKIAILSPFYPFRGGIAQLNARMYAELSKNNEIKAFTFTTLYPDFLFPGQTQFVAEDDSTTVIDSERILSSINPLSYVRTANIINKYAPDWLIIPYWISFLAPAFGIISRLMKKRTRIISLVHNAIPHERRFFDKSFARFFFKKCDGFIVFSEPVKQDLLKLVPDAHILLTPHPIYDHYNEKIGRREASEKLGVSMDKRTLLFFGLIREYKGLDILIEAMSLLDGRYQLIIAGESYDNFEKYQKLIDESPLKENIKVFGQYIPDNMVTTLFSASDVLILPYRSATQSGVVAVAYQLETPIIATNVGALGETVSSSGTGIVIDEVSPQAISEGIKSYFANTEKQAEYLSHIKAEKKRLSWSAFAQALQRFMAKAQNR